MRTTIALDPELLAEAKARAARRGTTLSEVVADALRASFQRVPQGGELLPELPVFQGDGLQPGVDLDDSGSLWDLDDGEGRWSDRS